MADILITFSVTVLPMFVFMLINLRFSYINFYFAADEFAILLTDCMTTSALNKQFIANLVLLRCHPSENASVIEYANFVETQLQNEKLEIRESYELFSVKNYSV